MNKNTRKSEKEMLEEFEGIISDFAKTTPPPGREYVYLAIGENLLRLKEDITDSLEFDEPDKEAICAKVQKARMLLNSLD